MGGTKLNINIVILELKTQTRKKFKGGSLKLDFPSGSESRYMACVQTRMQLK